ncbi:MAG: HNH endonuclease [Acidimicrobiaceae bacterium]|nr:HNH endonuclease [Acidimicrobiaceae bacterium]
MATRSPISISVIKALFAASPNVCAYVPCDEKLTDPGWKETNAEIAHICGERPGAPRYDSGLSIEERNSYDNLMLLCPKHHKLIDRLDPDGHPVEVLREMKAKSELHGSSSRAWATDEELGRLALIVVLSTSGDAPPIGSQPGPRLTVRRAGQRVVMSNVGSGAASMIVVVDEAEGTNSPVLLSEVPSSLPTGGRFNIGHWAQTYGTASFATLSVAWQDQGGDTYVERYPIN